MGRKLAGAAPRLPAPPLTTDAADVSLGGERSSWAGGAALLRRIRGGQLVQTARPDGELGQTAERPGVLK